MPGANDLFGVCQPEGDEEQPRLVHMVVVLIHDDDLDIRGWVEPPQAVCAQGAPGTPPGMTIRLGMLPLSAPDPGPNALYYLRGRPPYSLALRETIAAKCGLAGTGRLLDVGCGPGVLGVELAPLVGEVVGLDPDVDMLAEAARHARQARVANVQWVEALAEQIPELDLGTFRLVTFGQSFHRTDWERVAEAVFDVLEPGGNIALVAHTVEGRPEPAGPGLPKIPHEAIRSLVDKYLGPKPRAGRGFAAPATDRWEDALGRTRFGRCHQIFAPGRPDIVQDVDGVLANYLSMSFAAPHLFGDRLDLFVAEAGQALAESSPSGLFWDWPGDTEIVIAGKPR